MRVGLILLALLAAPLAWAATLPWTGVDDELTRRAADGSFSGAVSVSKHGLLLYSAARGNAVDTKFRFGSMGKMFTAVAIAQLAQAGKLSFGDPLGKYLTNYPNAEVAKITLHQLLTHTGGTGDIFGPEFLEKRAQLRELRDYVTLYGARAPEFPPGSRHEYSNYGFILLGRVIEEVSGASYDRYVREHIFVPAGMTSTDNQPESSRIPGLAVPYSSDPQGSLRPAADTLPWRGTSAGGGYSTVGDLQKFAQALLAHRLLDAKHTSLVLTGKVDTPRRGLRYAYGFEDAELPNGLHRVGHGGGAPGMNGVLAIYPEAGYVVVVLANRDPPAAMGMDRYIADHIVAAPR
ncbi:MAG TPA: serine hydrolase domain-containing protein [Steroidobacteraceae bacterium]